jgi:hypothetical protein
LEEQGFELYVSETSLTARAGEHYFFRLSSQGILALTKRFTIYTRWRRALGRSAIWRYYAIVLTADRRDLNELLVSAGLARIYGTRTPLPDGRDSRTYLAHLRELETQAKAARRGAWSKTQL